MIIGFDGSRAFAGDKTGTENYSYQLLKALARLPARQAKIDQKNQYVVYLQPNYSSNEVRSNLPCHPRSNRGSINIGIDSRWSLPRAATRGGNDSCFWPANLQFKEISWPRLWTQGGLGLQTFKDRLDVLFVPAHTLPIIRRPGLKTVVTVHDLGSEYLPSMHQLKQRLYLGFMQKIQLQTATKIIAVSKATKEDLVKRAGIDPDKVAVVYEGYDKDKFKIQNSKIKINQNIQKYNLMYHNYFLFVGTVQPRKNLERLITAFSTHLRGAKAHPGGVARQLVIAGSKGWLSDEIYKLPKKLGIEDRVKFLGYVPDEDLPILYAGAIALTFPSLFEGFGLPILEAQACGCPVVTSNLSSMPEVGGQGAIYVDPYSEDDIVEGMRRIMNHELRIKLIKAGTENIKRFSWEKCAEETLEVLENI